MAKHRPPHLKKSTGETEPRPDIYASPQYAIDRQKVYDAIPETGLASLREIRIATELDLYILQLCLEDLLGDERISRDETCISIPKYKRGGYNSRPIESSKFVAWQIGQVSDKTFPVAAII